MRFYSVTGKEPMVLGYRQGPFSEVGPRFLGLLAIGVLRKRIWAVAKQSVQHKIINCVLVVKNGLALLKFVHQKSVLFTQLQVFA